MMLGFLGLARHGVYKAHGRDKILELVAARNERSFLLPTRHLAQAGFDLSSSQLRHGRLLPWLRRRVTVIQALPRSRQIRFTLAGAQFPKAPKHVYAAQ